MVVYYLEHEDIAETKALGEKISTTDSSKHVDYDYYRSNEFRVSIPT